VVKLAPNRAGSGWVPISKIGLKINSGSVPTDDPHGFAGGIPWVSSLSSPPNTILYSNFLYVLVGSLGKYPSSFCVTIP
jgi:hypothetical protein